MKNTIFRIFFALLITLSPLYVSAGTEHGLSGWAWSSNIGWISFNCTNNNSCDTYAPGPGATSTPYYHLDSDQNWRISFFEYVEAIYLFNIGQMSESEYNLVASMYNYRSGTVRTGEYHRIPNGANYGVNKNADGSLTGYAWSPNIGWIQFGGLSGFPVGGGTQAKNADVAGNNPKGWIKAISADNNGWDGWISLAGSGYGVKFTDGIHLTSYAWGGDVVGWVLFDVHSTGVCADCGVKIGNGVELDVRNNATGETLLGSSTIAYGTVPNFVWTITNLPVGTSCNISKISSGGNNNISKLNLTTSGQESGVALIDATYQYNISCTNGGITSISEDTAPFTVLPNPADFSISIDGGSETPIQFLNSGSADSVEKTFYIVPSNFTDPVIVTLDNVSPSITPGTTFEYCFSSTSCTPMATSTQITITPPLGGKFRVRVSKKIESEYDITLRGTGGGLTRYAVFNLTPTVLDPKFEEF